MKTDSQTESEPTTWLNTKQRIELYEVFCNNMLPITYDTLPEKGYTAWARKRFTDASNFRLQTLTKLLRSFGIQIQQSLGRASDQKRYINFIAFVQASVEPWFSRLRVRSAVTTRIRHASPGDAIWASSVSYFPCILVMLLAL